MDNRGLFLRTSVEQSSKSRFYDTCFRRLVGRRTHVSVCFTTLILLIRIPTWPCFGTILPIRYPICVFRVNGNSHNLRISIYPRSIPRSKSSPLSKVCCLIRAVNSRMYHYFGKSRLIYCRPNHSLLFCRGDTQKHKWCKTRWNHVLGLSLFRLLGEYTKICMYPTLHTREI